MNMRAEQPPAIEGLKFPPGTSQVLNFMWLNLELPPKPDPEDGSIREPLPAKYIENVRRAGWARPRAQIVLWVDSKRLTKKQMDYLKEFIETGRPNVSLKDLRSIPDYDKEPLYNEGETNPNWRNMGQTALIWRQVDAAKVLVCLQGNFKQTFFADLDHAHLGITSPEVQGMIGKHGLMIGSMSGNKQWVRIENQLWGFNQSRRKFFEEYYAESLKCAYDGKNAWRDLVNKVENELTSKGIPLREMCLPIDADGTCAVHPGSEFRDGKTAADKPSLIQSGQLTIAFGKRHKSSGKAVILSASKIKAVPGYKFQNQLFAATA